MMRYKEKRNKTGRFCQTHGMTGTPIHNRWLSMKSRCYTKSSTNFAKWGGRGIKVCDRWHNFENFYKDMFKTFEEKLELDRIDNNKDYEPKNCRWISKRENTRNRSVSVNYKGQSSLDASVRLGGNNTLITTRMFRGWSKEKAFTTINKKKENMKVTIELGEIARVYGKTKEQIINTDWNEVIQDMLDTVESVD